MTTSEDRWAVDYERRLAVIEERTRPKPKSGADLIKDWASVGTLLIALLYSFPMGVWDKFFVTAAQSRDHKVEQLREIAVRLAAIEADTAKAYGTISDNSLRTAYSRAMSTQRLAIISGSLPIIRDHYSALSTPEMMTIAYELVQSSNFTLADRIYAAAAEKAEKDSNTSLMADIFRLKAEIYLGINGVMDETKVRANYSEGIGILMHTPTPSSVLQASNTAFEWARFELISGDWKCGENLGNWAITKARALPPVSPEIAAYAQQYEQVLGQFSKVAGQPEVGCPKNLIPWY